MRMKLDKSVQLKPDTSIFLFNTQGCKSSQKVGFTFIIVDCIIERCNKVQHKQIRIYKRNSLTGEIFTSNK